MRVRFNHLKRFTSENPCPAFRVQGKNALLQGPPTSSVHFPGPACSNPTRNSTLYFRDAHPPLAPKCLPCSKPFQLHLHYCPSQPTRGSVLPQAFHRPGLQPLGPVPATPLTSFTRPRANQLPLPATPHPPPPRLPAPPPAGTHIFRCRSNSAFFSSSSRFCFSSRLLRLLTVRPKMSMRSGGDEARSRSRSRRDTAVLVERERDRDSRRRFRLLSRDLERFRTRSLSRDRDRDRLRFLLCLLLLVCLERDELRLRDRPILPGDAGTNRWLRAPHVPGCPRLRFRKRAGNLVEAGGRRAISELTFCLPLRPTAATKAAANDKAATPGIAKMAAAAAPAAPPTRPRAQRAVTRAPPPDAPCGRRGERFRTRSAFSASLKPACRAGAGVLRLLTRAVLLSGKMLTP